MPRVIDLIRRSVESKAFPTRLPPLAELRASEWDDEFEQLMRNRLLMGAFRYCPMQDKFDGDGGRRRWDMIGSTERRLAAYRADRNLEHLVDVANLMLLEFLQARADGAKLAPIDDGEHVGER